MPRTPGRTSSASTCTSSSAISPVIEARSDSLSSISFVVTPALSVSTRNPRTGWSSSVWSFAQTTATSAIGEFVIHVFEPFST